MNDNGTTVHLAGPAAEEYLDGVRAALADLPAPEVAEILDDVRAHLADLTAELGGEADVAALTERLGPPSAYAAELRAAAGYPAADPEETGRSRHGVARLAVLAPAAGGLVFLLGAAAGEPSVVLTGLLIGAVGLPIVIRDGPQVPRVAALPEVRWLLGVRPVGTTARTVTDFVAGLQPGWWVVRAIAAAALVVAAFFGGGAPAVLLLAVLAVPVSIWVGHRTRRDRRLLWGVVPLNALAALVLLWMLFDGMPDESSASSYPVSLPGLWQDGDREIQDIRPVDGDGNPLAGVYLFDQDGMPIDTSGSGCSGRDSDLEPGANAAYPRGTWDYDPRTGRCRHTPPGPLVVAVPTTPAPGDASATPAPTAAPTSGPVPTPPGMSAAPTPPGMSAAPTPPATPLAPPPVAPPTR
ncbi:HAAS signaling domain-containing protein [Pseudonocardia sp. DLS-67]